MKKAAIFFISLFTLFLICLNIYQYQDNKKSQENIDRYFISNLEEVKNGFKKGFSVATKEDETFLKCSEKIAAAKELIKFTSYKNNQQLYTAVWNFSIAMNHNWELPNMINSKESVYSTLSEVISSPENSDNAKKLNDIISFIAAGHYGKDEMPEDFIYDKVMK